ncbi:MAG: DUF177 domain-containing protein [Magnetococcales bacterium]|nr:DUF177 domain-containing protein [Magnetococcales bacterium]
MIHLDVKSTREKRVVLDVPGESLSLLMENMALTSPVMVDVTVARANDKWRVSGTLAYRVERACARCLEPFPMEQISRVDRLFGVGVDPGLGKKNIAMEDDLTWLENGELTIQELVQEEILLDSPMRSLCDEGCRGLCPDCGVNRNQNPCHCDGKVREGPFSRLKDLKLS